MTSHLEKAEGYACCGYIVEDSALVAAVSAPPAGQTSLQGWGNCMLQVQHGEGKLIPLAAMLLPQVQD